MRAQTPQPREGRKTNKDHACKLKAKDWKNVTKLDYTSRFVQQCFSRELDQTTSLAETSRHIDSTYHETLKSFPRIREHIQSSQPENKTLLRVATAARCDNKATKCTWLAGQSLHNSTFHVEDNKT